MSGIAGAYQQVDGEPAARLMSERLAHRGPDGDGFYSFVNNRVSAYIGHRRLAVLDPANGHQPLVKHHLALSYDGTLYNFHELSAELASSGSKFETRSDAEVVLEAWRRWGHGCLRRLRGMFAFALFDEATGSLFFARDQFGIKPLHYLRRKDGVVFASELKALVAAFGPELQIEPGALIASILYYWVPDRRCSVHKVEKLQPGTWAEFRPDGTFRTETYFDIAEVAAVAAAGPPVDLAEVIEASVVSHLVADVPVSSLLSGGLDSSIVAALAKRANPDVDAYTVTFRPKSGVGRTGAAGAARARNVARSNGIDLHEIQVALDVADLLPKLVGILDEPIGDPGAITTLLMFEAARESGAKVFLSGMGADELFAGHDRYATCVMAERYNRLPGFVRQAAGALVGRLPAGAPGRRSKPARWAKRVVALSELPEEAAFRSSYSLYDPLELAALVSPELGPDVDDVMEEHLEVYCDNYLSDHVNRMCLADVRLFLPGLKLTYTDRASMATSSEIRYPFVDPVVFRAAFAFTGQHKVRNMSRKVMLRQAARAWLPDEVVHHPRAHFSAPLRDWVAGDLRGTVDDVLLRGQLLSTGFLHADAVSTLVGEDRAGLQDHSQQIWQLLTLEYWYRQACEAGVGL